jgi:DNA topoisomerase-1
MKKKVLIVESPAKARTIKKFLGKNYEVASSFGHIADLPEHEMGIEIEKNFKPKYVISPDKKKIIKQLKELVENAEEVYLASDEDREGEAIAWHLKNFLKLDDKAKRIVFHEITEKAIKNALQQPRQIDENLVNAQQARRLLDRLVGYRLSPVLWKKIKKGLSAGRVQSVALRLIVEREKEIREFEPAVSYKVEGIFAKEKSEAEFKARLDREFGTEEETIGFFNDLKNKVFTIDEVKKKKGRRTPSAPFTTSTLQQEAASKLGFSVSRTMQIAQYLYENGYITYMRTDSVHLSDEAIDKARTYIVEKYGTRYARPKQYKTKSKSAQEAHEAIRPTDIYRESPSLDRDAARLYKLIWQRTVASQMAPAEIDHTNISIKVSETPYHFKAKGEVLTFDGFLKIYQPSDYSGDAKQLPDMKVGEKLEVRQIIATEKYSRPPVRYNEASLVKKLEELGIGRPSTYAPTISIIQKRGYAERKNVPSRKRKIKVFEWIDGELHQKTVTETYGGEKQKLIPTDIGIIVNDFLVKNFENIVDYGFTAQVENKFDKIARGKYDWVKMLKEFYGRFEPEVEKVIKESKKEKGERLLGKDPETGKNVYVKYGPFGPMVQLGEASDTEKPRYASLLPSMSLVEITLEEALKLLELPKEIGTYNNRPVVLGTGKYGPYIRYGNKFISIPSHINPLALTLEEAIALIERKLDREKPVARWQGRDVFVLSGKYGPYLKWGEMNIKLPRNINTEELTEDTVVGLIKEKIEKDKKNTVKEWKDEGISIRKGGWGRLYVFADGKRKKILPKNIDVEKITLDEVKKIISGKE